MSIEAEQLDEWIGSEVVDPDGVKLGKVAEVYYHGADPVIVEVRSGITGRNRSLSALAGATVSMKHLRLTGADSVATGGGISTEALEQLAAHDPRLTGVTAEQLESGSERAARVKAAEDAAAHATVLEAEAAHRKEEALIAANVAREAADRAAALEQARADAVDLAERARSQAEDLQRRLS
jgi:hypothetical protein